MTDAQLLFSLLTSFPSELLDGLSQKLSRFRAGVGIRRRDIISTLHGQRLEWLKHQRPYIINWSVSIQTSAALDEGDVIWGIRKSTVEASIKDRLERLRDPSTALLAAPPGITADLGKTPAAGSPHKGVAAGRIGLDPPLVEPRSLSESRVDRHDVGELDVEDPVSGDGPQAAKHCLKFLLAPHFWREDVPPVPGAEREMSCV